MIIWYWSVKGGSGTSVVAATTALRLAASDNDHETTLVDLTGDQPAVLGASSSSRRAEPAGLSDWITAGDAVAADAIGRLLEDIVSGMRLLRRGTNPIDPASDRKRLLMALEMLARNGPVVVDAGMDEHRLRDDVVNHFGVNHLGNAANPVCVPICVMRPCFLAIDKARQLGDRLDNVILVAEPGRALGASDISSAVGASHCETIAWDPKIARSVDAGTMVSLLPLALRRFELPPWENAAAQSRQAA